MKPELRAKIRKLLAAIPPADVRRRGRAACEALVELDEFRSANVVMIYMTIPGEVDTGEIALAAWRQQKKVLAPKVFLQHKHMVAREIHTLDTGLASGPYDIPEPAAGEPWPVGEIDFVVVPAMAYDRRGRRLGRGGGFYDRFLGQPGFRAFACGLALAEQLVEEVPTEAHDRPVNALVTDREVLRFAAS